MKKQLLFVVSIVLTVTLYAQNIPNILPTKGLVGCWPFNGIANDESGNGNHGTVYGATLTTDRNGIENKAQNQQKNTSYKPGVVISFDDAFIDEWYKVNDTLIQYDWKATFFVTQFQKLSSDKLKKINQLKDLGHEIGGHGYNHLDAQKFCLSNGINQYLNQEISPMILSMRNNGVVPTSFAYPYGSRNHLIDSTLFNHFQILRGTTYGNLLPADQKCYFDNNRLVFGIGIDSHYSHFNISYFIELLKYALEQNKIVIFYAHKPVLSYTKKYETEYSTLLEICKFVKNNKMKFYTMSELACTTPIATITPQTANSFCSGGSVNINAATNANYTYQWLNNGTPISAATTATYKATTSGKYSVIVKNNSGCIDTSSVVTVNVSATPSLPILTGPATLCYNSKAIFKASIAGGTWGVANDYLMISSPQGLFRNNKMPPSNLYKTGVTYTLKSKDKLCSITAQKSVWIRNVAATSVTLTASKQTLKVGEEVAATATTKITGNLLYWLSASTSFVSVAGTSSPYIAIVKGLRPVTDANITFSIDDLSKGCRNAAFLPFNVTAAASLVENESNTSSYTTDLNVYPNPSNGMVTIENIGDAKTISLIDVTGRVLKTTAVNADRMRLDYSTITKGNYFISIQGENLKEMKSIVIE